MNIDRAESLIIAIVPLDQVAVDLSTGSKPSQFAGPPGALKGTCEYPGELQALEPIRQSSRVGFALGGQGQVRHSRVLACDRPSGFAVPADVYRRKLVVHRCDPAVISQAASRAVWISILLRYGASFFLALNTLHCAVPTGTFWAAAISWYSNSSIKRSVNASRSRESRKAIQLRNSKAGPPAGWPLEATKRSGSSVRSTVCSPRARSLRSRLSALRAIAKTQARNRARSRT